MIKRTVRILESRLGAGPLIRTTLKYVFPDHWSFMLGEIALYCFFVLVATGIYLTFFFEPSTAHVIYHGRYAPLDGAEMSRAYLSTMQISFAVKAGLLIRQTHHWAADVFLATLVVHAMRVFFTGAFRKPRDLNVAIGTTMLALAILEGYLGYSLVDDLLSGMGLAIGYSVLASVPVVGGWLAALVWAGGFPGGDAFWSRLFIAHVLIFPVLIGGLLALHLAIIVRQKHSQFPGRGATERNVVGLRLWPSYAFRSIALLLATAGVLLLLGGLVQINPIWQWGPFHTYLSTNGAEPDWYIGWMIGALRLMPPLELHAWGYTFAPNPFFGGVLFPLVVFAFLYLWPAFERKVTGDRARHELLERPRDNPWRTAVGAAFFTWVTVFFVAGSADRLAVIFSFSYAGQIWFFRIASIVLPVVAFFATRRICEDLRRTGIHPFRGFTGRIVRRTPTGGFDTIRKE
jgi:ubiquinol-cytochrome c reductase cytochrome b subunit